MPRPEAYFEPIDWHWTALHELSHWSGAQHRLGRDLSGGFGSKLYAKEELVAEISAAFLCAKLGITPTVRHSDYIASWLDVLREDMLFGGAPMGGPRYIWWNFVSSRLDRIEQAKEEWAQGRFDTVPGDVEEFIPLPQTKHRPRRATGGVFYP